MCLEAIAKELVVQYVCCCIQNKKQPTVEECQEWLTSVEDNSYLFFYHIAFAYLLSFQLLIEAVRKNYSDMVIAARIQFAPLFYSFPHPKYQQLHLQDEYIWQRVQMPQEIREYISTNESISVSGRENSGQGGDFVHEELKKRIKALLPRIMPTADVWSRACRKLSDLEEIRDNTIR